MIHDEMERKGKKQKCDDQITSKSSREKEEDKKETKHGK